MNGLLIMVGIIAAVPIFLFSVLAYRLGSLADDFALSDFVLLADNSSLEEDFKDILELVSSTDVQLIVNNYLRYDSQINDTVSFIEDQKNFIAREFQQMPQLDRLVKFLAANGLQIDYWKTKIQNLWKTKANFIKSDPNIATGGFTGMVQKILNTIPKNELHELLRQKVKYSSSFRRLLYVLKSKDFMDFCDAVDKNIVLQRHIFWAKQEGIEITFFQEFLRNLYIYVTEEIY